MTNLRSWTPIALSISVIAGGIVFCVVAGYSYVVVAPEAKYARWPWESEIWSRRGEILTHEWDTGTSGNSDREIRTVQERIEDILARAGKPIGEIPKGGGFYPETPISWREIDRACEDLAPKNSEICLARAMRDADATVTHFVPNSPFSSEPEQSNPWLIGVASGTACFVIFAIVLLGVPWLWHFFLNRLREMSAAVRGQ